MILRNMLEIFVAFLCVHKIGVETTKLGHVPSPRVQLENLEEVVKNTAEYQDCHVLSRLVSMLEMRLENAERQLSELKDVKEKINTQRNELKDVTERLNHAEKRISVLEVLVKKTISDNQTNPKQEHDEEANYQVNNNHEESGHHFFSDGLNPIKKPNTTNILKAKKGSFHSARRNTGSRGVAFTVALRDHITSISAGQIVPFDTVLYNEGNLYNGNSHMFTCPMSGTYLFTLSGTVGRGVDNVIYVSLIVNGATKTHVAAAGSNGGNQGSSTILTRCEAGQNVWVSVYGGTFLHGDFYTSFSGVLLWTDELGSK